MVLGSVFLVPVCSAQESNPAPKAPTAAAVQVSGDPKTLDVPTPIAVQAKALVAQLANPVYKERELAQRDIAKLGRLALPAMREALATSTEAEVAVRIDQLLPRAEIEDMTARVACFLADAEGKYEHTLPGWEKFKSVAGNEKSSRKIFAEALKNQLSQSMLLAAERMSIDESSLLLGQFVMKINGNPYQRGDRNEEARTPPKTGELAVALFLEGQFSDKRMSIQMPGQFGWGSYYSVMNGVYGNADFNNALNSTKGETSETLRKLIVQWMDTRETMNGLNTAYSMANNFYRSNQKQALKYAAKMMAIPSTQNDYHQKQGALQNLGTQGGADYLGLIAKCFDDTSKVWYGQSNNPDVDVELRDQGLATVLQLADVKPEEFGMSRNGDAKQKLYNAQSFYFKDDRPAAERLGNVGGRIQARVAVAVVKDAEKKPDAKEPDKKDPKKDEKITSDDRRKVAFKKYEEWAKTNIDKDGKLIKKDKPKKDDTKKHEEPTAAEDAAKKPAEATEQPKKEKK